MKRFVILGVVILAVIGIWTGLWLWGAGQVRSAIVGLGTGDPAAVPTLACDQLDIGGYPFGIDVTCAGATLVSGDTTVTLKGLKATALVYQPNAVLAFGQGPALIADAFTGSQRQLDFASLAASVRLTDWRIARVSVVIDHPVWQNSLLGNAVIAAADHAEFQLIDIPESHDIATHLAALAGYVKVDGASLPDMAIASGTIEAEVELNGLPDDVRTLGADPLPLRSWQRAGGKLTLVRLTGQDALSQLESSGTLGLDDQGRAEGQINISSKGVVERLGPLVPENLRGLVLGAEGPDGLYTETLNLRAGIVFAGLIPAAVIPPLY